MKIHFSFLDFVNVANSFRRHYGETNPCLVHCTAGYVKQKNILESSFALENVFFSIGRTGVFILIHVMIQCITFNKVC